MKYSSIIVLGLCVLASLTGCEHPYARLSTLQDPKYPIARDSKIALAIDKAAPANDVATRLGGETIEEQMRALGFHVVPAAEADFILGFTLADKDESVTFNQTVPVMTNVVGSIGDRPITGTVFSDQVVPHTRQVSMTYLQVTLQRTQDPKVEAWHGSIITEAATADNFRTPFFRALLERIGETTRGNAQLDSDEMKGK